jgi:hypothetical protein
MKSHARAVIDTLRSARDKGGPTKLLRWPTVDEHSTLSGAKAFDNARNFRSRAVRTTLLIYNVFRSLQSNLQVN